MLNGSRVRWERGQKGVNDWPKALNLHKISYFRKVFHTDQKTPSAPLVVVVRWLRLGSCKIHFNTVWGFALALWLVRVVLWIWCGKYLMRWSTGTSSCPFLAALQALLILFPWTWLRALYICLGVLPLQLSCTDSKDAHLVVSRFELQLLQQRPTIFYR